MSVDMVTGDIEALNHRPLRCGWIHNLTPNEKSLAEWGCDEVPPTRPCKGGQYRPRKLDAPSRKLPEREMGDPEGNLVIVERVEHECQRRFSDWEYGWVGTAHVLTSTLYGWTDSSWHFEFLKVNATIPQGDRVRGGFIENR